MSNLTDLKIKSLNKVGRHSDGNSLYLKVSRIGKKSWSCRFLHNGKTFEMGLGTYPAISLREARRKRSEIQLEVARGNNPLTDQQAKRQNEQRLKEMTFEKAARECHAVKKLQWKNGKHQKQWIGTLQIYVFPILGSKSVKDIQATDVVACLKPIWLTKVETAQRLRQRIELVLNWAKAMGYRDGENPALLKGNLEYLLPTQKKEVIHYPALPYEQLAAFWLRLNECCGVAADALRILILTATRSGEVRGALWKEIDFEHAIWTIPAERMKAGKPHRVPLCQVAMAILLQRKVKTNSHLVFEGLKQGKPISDMAMLSLMRKRFSEVDAVPHGFRSTFRDWAENQSFSHRAVEYCLAHTLRNKVEAAYQRDELLEQRRDIMEAWQSHTTLSKTQEI